MLKRTSKTKKQKEANDNAVAGIKKAIKSAADIIEGSILAGVASALGKKGGKIGAKSRMETMSPEGRGQVAVKPAKARRNKRLSD